MKAKLRLAVLLLGTIAVGFFGLNVWANATDLSVPPANGTVQGSQPNSIFVFGGLMSTTDIFSTMLLNLNSGAQGGQHYDNYIFGGAYDRDLLSIGYGFHLGVEVGIADRFGYYRECCDTVIKSSGLIQSDELWGGVQIRNEGILLFNRLRIGAAVTVGLSAVTASIGREYEREIEAPGNASLLYYLGPELDLSTPNLKNLEFVLKLQHRSGSKDVSFLPTLGNMAEGYNANVAGIRYRF